MQGAAATARLLSSAPAATMLSPSEALTCRMRVAHTESASPVDTKTTSFLSSLDARSSRSAPSKSSSK